VPVIDLDRADATCGGKALGLGRLSRSGFNVPSGFVVVGDLDAQAFAAGVHRLDGPLAVRSSGLDEDSASASFAGQLETVLGVVGVEDAGAAVRVCSRSATSDRARAYAARVGAATQAHVPVIVQRLVAAEVAGVVFTHDPRTGLDDVVIEAAWGLGESVVNGRVIPDTMIVTVAGTVHTSLGSKATRLDLRDDGLRRSAVASADRRRPALTEAQITEVARTARAAQGAFGYPLDIEWAIADGTLWLLQARPITTHPQPPRTAPATQPERFWCAAWAAVPDASAARASSCVASTRSPGCSPGTFWYAARPTLRGRPSSAS
jgi:pyruvate,water dikinase